MSANNDHASIPRPPFILDQGMRRLTDIERPKDHISAAASAADGQEDDARGAGSHGSGPGKQNVWQQVPRQQVAADVGD